MALNDRHLTSTSRYAGLSRPLGNRVVSAGPVMPQPLPIVGIHSQTILFIVFAVMVGAGLATIAPKLSAAANLDSSAVEESRVEVSPNHGSSSVVPDNSAVQGENGIAPSLEAATVPNSGGISPVFTREVRFWEQSILEWSKIYNLDPDIIATIMQIESCGDPGAASHAGAQGLFQVMPFHFEAGEDMLDPDTNAWRGMAFYNRQLEYTGGDVYLSFAGYNGGYAASGGSYQNWAAETQRYFMWAKGIYDEAKSGVSVSPTLQNWLQAGGGGGCQRAAARLGL